MLSHPIVRTALGVLAAGALAGGLAPMVLAHGAPASARGERAARAVLVVDRVEDRFEKATMQEKSEAHAAVARAQADVDKARADADDQKADADDQKADVDDQMADADADSARDMAQAQAVRAQIESAEQAAMAREEAREARIRALIAQFTQMAR